MSHLQFPYHPWDWTNIWLNVYGKLVGKYTVRPMNPMGLEDVGMFISSGPFFHSECSKNEQRRDIKKRRNGSYKLQVFFGSFRESQPKKCGFKQT